MGFSMKGAKIIEELWDFRGRVPKSSVNYGFSEEGCCVKNIVHERARLSAVAVLGLSVRPPLSPREVVARVPTAERCGQERGFKVTVLLAGPRHV